MSYKQHPDYPIYENDINSILNSNFEIIKHEANNTISKVPEKLKEIHFLNQHIYLTQFINQRYGKISTFYIIKPQFNTEEPKVFCRCDCGNLCTLTKSEIKACVGQYGACSECRNQVLSFDRAFFMSFKKFLSTEVVCSIFKIPNKNEIKDFVRFDQNSIEEDTRENLLRNASDKDLIALLSKNTPKEIKKKYFPLAENNINYINNKTGEQFKNLQHIPFEVKVFEKGTESRVINQRIGKKLFRLKILGVSAKTKNLTTEHISYTAQCDCGSYCTIRHKSLTTNKLPTCIKCVRIIEHMILRAKNEENKILSAEEIWQTLGYNTKDEDEKLNDFKQNMLNSYKFERQVHENVSVKIVNTIKGKKFGLVKINGKSVRKKQKHIFVAGTCDCKNDCIFPLNIFFNKKGEDLFLSCSACATELLQTFIMIESTQFDQISLKRFNSIWEKYLSYHNLSTTLSFYKAYSYFIKVKEVRKLARMTSYLLRILQTMDQKLKKGT